MSSFFHKILLKNPHQHPLIYLKGIKRSDLESIINFIYMGETEIGREDLERFMTSAKELEIQGLIEDEENEQERILIDDKSETEAKRERNKIKSDQKDGKSVLKVVDADNITDEYECFDFLDVKTEESDECEMDENSSDNTNLESSFGDHSFVTEMQSDGSEIFNCNQCDKKLPMNKRRNIKKHLAKHQAQQIRQCDECDKQCNSNEALKYHKQSVHDGIRFPCDHCDHKARTPQGLKKHEARKHTDSV
eukprot:GFUD01073516.1.p1 GENE.GFUD01073516.1~~GFUD01073516.1.p1  ORF type:complete len:249 (+),score=58.57 GFUD01073516.1:92-838(+)